MIRWSDTPQNAGLESGPGVVINATSRTALLADLDACLKAQRGFSVATLNLDHVIKLRNLPEFRGAYLRQTHVTADGNPIVWFSRLSGHNISLVPGSELIEPITEMAVRNGVPIALLGSTQTSLEAAAEALKIRHPGLQVTATIAPPMGFDPTGPQALDCIDELKSSGARLCFVALGAPKQEIFAAYASTLLPYMGFLSIGAGLDFISGSQTRAPKIMRTFAAEWLWRLASDPHRLAKRYAACIAILPSLLHMALRTRFQDESRHPE